MTYLPSGDGQSGGFCLIMMLGRCYLNARLMVVTYVTSNSACTHVFRISRFIYFLYFGSTFVLWLLVVVVDGVENQSIYDDLINTINNNNVAPVGLPLLKKYVLSIR